LARDDLAARPTKKNEFVLVFASRSASVGWRDLIATQRNLLADAWDFLTRTPLLTTPKNYELRGELATVTRDGKTFARWQHKPSLKGDARIWFFVDGQTVYLERVFTSHPNQTK
jgi:hypothetical protein